MGDQTYSRWFTDWPSTHVLAGQTVEVTPVPASFTDEDVERVAEALWRQEFDKTPDEMREDSRREHESDGWVDDYVEACEDTARAALSAYLEPTTKKET